MRLLFKAQEVFHHVNSILSYMYTAWLSRKPPTPYPLLPTPPPKKINKMLEAKLHSDFHLVWHKAALPQLTAALKEYK